MIRGQRETELERPLSETEVEAILKQLGSPLVVAHRFLPERFLIGPVLFPLYLFVLKIAVACALAPAVLAWLAMLVTGPYTATAPTWLHALRSVASSCWTAVFASAGIVTIAFAVLDRVQTKTRFLDEFNPRKIPAVRDPSLIPRTGSFVELAFYLAG